jgi:protein-arginine kinase activator protein McsA
MKDFGKFLSSQDPNEMSATMFETLARDNIKDFLQFFRKDYYEKIDFDKGCTFLDEALPHFVPAHYRERKDALNLFVKATLKKGGICHFLVHAIFTMQKGEIQVGIADVPDKAMKAYQKAKDSGELEPKREYTDDNQCTVCGRTDLPLTITINASTMTKKTICSVCMHNGGPSGQQKKKKVNLKKLDEEIADYEKLAKKYEEMIKEMPESPKLPAALAQYAMTPLSNYKSIQAILGDLRAQRMAAMTDMNSEVRLEYELKKSLAAEDYEQSAVIRDKLNKKKKGK